MSEYANAIQLPEYVCHKRVRAAKILGAKDGVDVAGVVLRIEHPDYPEAVHYQTCEWALKHAVSIDDLVGGYLVQYADGYTSWSPAKAFEEGYRLAEPLGQGEQQS